MAEDIINEEDLTPPPITEDEVEMQKNLELFYKYIDEVWELEEEGELLNEKIAEAEREFNNLPYEEQLKVMGISNKEWKKLDSEVKFRRKLESHEFEPALQEKYVNALEIFMNTGRTYSGNKPGRKPLSEEEKQRRKTIREQIQKEENQLGYAIGRIEEWFGDCEKYNIPRKEIDDLKLLCNFGIKYHYEENRNKYQDKFKKDMERLKKRRSDIDTEIESKKIDYENEIEKFNRLVLID